MGWIFFTDLQTLSVTPLKFRNRKIIWFVANKHWFSNTLSGGSSFINGAEPWLYNYYLQSIVIKMELNVTQVYRTTIIMQRMY